MLHTKLRWFRRLHLAVFRVSLPKLELKLLNDTTFWTFRYLILLLPGFLILNNYWRLSLVLWFFFQVHLDVKAVFSGISQVSITCYSYKVYPFPISTSATILSSLILWTLNFRLPHEMVSKTDKMCRRLSVISPLKPSIRGISEKNARKYSRVAHGTSGFCLQACRLSADWTIGHCSKV